MKILPSLHLAAMPLLLLAACAPVASNSAGVGPERISQIDYAVGPCHGFCPAYSVTLRGGAPSEFRGERYTKEAGTRAFRLGTRVFTSISTLVIAARKSAGTASVSHETCKLYATDQQKIEIRWANGKNSETFEFDLGCHDQQYEESRSLVSKARALMPINAFVGRRTRF